MSIRFNGVTIIFNVADICITCGAALAILSFLWQDARRGKTNAAQN